MTFDEIQNQVNIFIENGSNHPKFVFVDCATYDEIASFNLSSSRRDVNTISFNYIKIICQSGYSTLIPVKEVDGFIFFGDSANDYYSRIANHLLIGDNCEDINMRR